jgi:hypothetical protein
VEDPPKVPADASDAPEAPDTDEEERPAGRGPEEARGPARSERVWVVVACLCLAAAAVFLWRGNSDATFVAAALAASFWFLNVRARLRREHNIKRRK